MKTQPHLSQPTDNKSRNSISCCCCEKQLHKMEKKFLYLKFTHPKKLLERAHEKCENSTWNMNQTFEWHFMFAVNNKICCYYFSTPCCRSRNSSPKEPQAFTPLPPHFLAKCTKAKEIWITFQFSVERDHWTKLNFFFSIFILLNASLPLPLTYYLYIFDISIW